MNAKTENQTTCRTAMIVAGMMVIAVTAVIVIAGDAYAMWREVWEATSPSPMCRYCTAVHVAASATMLLWQAIVTSPFWAPFAILVWALSDPKHWQQPPRS